MNVNVIMLYKVVQTFESVNEILKYDHSNQNYWIVLSCGMVVLPFESVDGVFSPSGAYTGALKPQWLVNEFRKHWTAV